MQVPQCCLCPAATTVIRWHLGLSPWDAAESSSDRESWLFRTESVGQGGFTLPVVTRKKPAAAPNLLSAREAKFVPCTALFVYHSKSHKNLLAHLSWGNPRKAPPDFKAVTGCLRLHADFSGEAPNLSAPGSPQGCVVWSTPLCSVFHIPDAPLQSLPSVLVLTEQLSPERSACQDVGTWLWHILSGTALDSIRKSSEEIPQKADGSRICSLLNGSLYLLQAAAPRQELHASFWSPPQTDSLLRWYN